MNINKPIIKIALLLVSVVLLSVFLVIAGPVAIFNTPGKNKISNTDPWRVIDHISRKYLTDSTISQAGTIKLYDEHKPGTILEQYDCLYYLSKDRIYSQIGPRETYSDGNFLLSSDKDNKILCIIPAGNNENTGIPNMRQLKKMINKVNGKLEVIMDEGSEALSFSSEFDTEISSYRIYFNPVTWEVTKIKMKLWKDDAFMQQDAKPLTLEINYTKMTVIKDYPEQYGRSRFLKPGSGDIVVQPEYEQFELVNQLSINKDY